MKIHKTPGVVVFSKNSHTTLTIQRNNQRVPSVQDMSGTWYPTEIKSLLERTKNENLLTN